MKLQEKRWFCSNYKQKPSFTSFISTSFFQLIASKKNSANQLVIIVSIDCIQPFSCSACSRITINFWSELGSESNVYQFCSLASTTCEEIELATGENQHFEFDWHWLWKPFLGIWSANIDFSTFLTPAQLSNLFAWAASQSFRIIIGIPRKLKENVVPASR